MKVKYKPEKLSLYKFCKILSEQQTISENEMLRWNVGIQHKLNFRYLSVLQNYFKETDTQYTDSNLQL